MFYHKGTEAQRGRGYNGGAMNEEQKKQVEIAMESHRRALEMLEDDEFMEGVFEAAEAVKRGERGVPAKELKRKYKRA